MLVMWVCESKSDFPKTRQIRTTDFEINNKS